MIRKETFFNLGAFREDFEICEDFEFFLRYLHFYPIGLVKTYDQNQEEQALTIKRSGGWPQLSKKYHSMDKWRIRAIILYLNKYQEVIDEETRQAALSSLFRKRAIIQNGRKKRHKNNL